jgi:hypothetical protein
MEGGKVEYWLALEEAGSIMAVRSMVAAGWGNGVAPV